MSSSASNKLKTKSGKKRGGDGVRAVNITAAQQSAQRPKRRAAGDRNLTEGANVEKVNTIDPGRDDNAPTNMFHGNIAISGGQFTQNVNNNRTESFKLLQHRVAPSAFHNSAVRFDPPRCHPDTRVEILQSIYDWIIQSDDREEWLLWLNGAAGAGKSAIMQSIAERCAQAAISIASFFFFRSDPTRNTTGPLVATLAYQLIQTIPETLNDILLTIERNPLIFDQSIESQLQHLIIQPLLRLPRRLQHLFVVLVDGLDECIDRARQSSLIKLFGTVSRGQNSPILFLIASRREPQIEAAFVERRVSRLLRTLPLDNSDIEQTSEDIRHFLTDKFHDITETHLRRHLIPTDWPPASAVEEIVAKSSGQFIYASVVVNYISSPRYNPAHLLEIVCGIRLRDPASLNPFAHLDALYLHIFDQVEALDQVLDILAFILITETSDIHLIEGPFLLERGGLEICLADLTAVVECDGNNEVGFLHASLPDFLRDKTRSERYYINVEEYVPKLLCMVLDRYSSQRSPFPRSSMYRSDAYSARLNAILYLLDAGPTASDQLQRSFTNFRFKLRNGFPGDDVRITVSIVRITVSILKCLKKLNFNDRGRAYRHVRDVFAKELVKFGTLQDELFLNDALKGTDLLACISRIRQEL